MENVIDVKSSDLSVLDGKDATQAFAAYAEEREKWLSTPIAKNTTLAKSGTPFTIIAATQRDMPATELDVPRGYSIGDPIPKIAYLCISQQEWWHYDPQGEDICYPEGEPFVILMNPNPIRQKDCERVQDILAAGGKIYNVCLREIPPTKKGFSPAHTLVSQDQWKALSK